MASNIGKFVVVGASGYVGKATVKALAAKLGAGRVVVATRDPSSEASGQYTSQGVTVVKGDMGDAAGLREAFAGAAGVFVIAPGHEDRASLAVNALEAVKAANVAFVVVLSVPTAGDESKVFGAQFSVVESAVKRLDVPHTIVRLPLFTDNLWGQAESIKTTGKFYGPVAPSSLQAAVAVSDIGEAVANILSSPTSHVGQTYVLSGRAYSNAEVAAALSKSLGRDIEYVQIPYDAAFESFVGAGWPAWQVKGLLEVFRACDAGEFVYDDSVLARVLGRPPLTIEEWVESVKAGFTA